jgi:hypothetical protein
VQARELDTTAKEDADMTTLNFPGFPPVKGVGPVITEIRALPVPRGYVGVEHDGGTVHAIDLDDLSDDRPLWRETPVCGTGTGVSSDEGGPYALHRREITCIHCIGILS